MTSQQMTMHPTVMRLNKYLVAAGVVNSRRKADDLIAAGQVTVNDQLASLGAKVELQDEIKLNGRGLKLSKRPSQVVLLNKPVGVVSSHVAQGGEATVFDLIPAEYASFKLIGRLDKDSQGLVVLTNDGALVQALSHPSHLHSKVYRVWLDKPLRPSDHKLLVTKSKGIKLKDGISYFDDLQDLGSQAYSLTLHGGRNRQIRRTFQAINYRVVKLMRVRLADYELGDLKLGEWRISQHQYGSGDLR